METDLHITPKDIPLKTPETQQTLLLSPTARHGYIPGLDGLRACAVILVIAAHFGLSHILPGGFGVTIFFFVSGFLITRLLIAEVEQTGTLAVKNFFIRRIIRLYPALLFMVLGSTLLYGILGHGGPSALEFFAAIGYFTNIFQTAAAAHDVTPFMPWTHLWSLAVEEHFYLLFPLILMATGLKWDKLFLVLIAFLILTPLWRAVSFYGLPVDPEYYHYMLTQTRIDSIVWGCLLSVVLHRVGHIKPFQILIGWVPLAIASAAIVWSFLYRDDSFRYIWRYSLQGAALAVLMLNFFYFEALRTLVTLMEWSPLSWVGKTSYGLYLWHYPVYDLCQRSFGETVFSLCLAVLGSFVMTAISFYIVEKSFLKLRRRFGSVKPLRVAGS